MEKHFVKFLCPGAFVHEEESFPVDSWDVDSAIALAKTVVARYEAKPFAFEFYTRSRTDEDLDSKITKTSKRYYLGGRIETIADVEEKADPKDEILLHNMKYNNWNKIIVNTNSYRVTQPFNDDDVLLDIVI